MKIPSILTPVLLLGALPAIAAAQGCACTSFSPNVAVTVSEGPAGAARVDQNRICVARGGVVTFQSDEGDVEIAFNKGDGSPFPFNFVRRSRGQRLGARITQANAQQCGRTFRYTVRLTKDGRNLVLDPEIIVEPGGDQQ
jgi:hypothetical protein